MCFLRKNSPWYKVKKCDFEMNDPESEPRGIKWNIYFYEKPAVF